MRSIGSICAITSRKQAILRKYETDRHVVADTTTVSEKMAKSKVGGKKSKAAAAAGTVQADRSAAEAEGEDRPVVVRLVTVGAVSYIAHKIWTKRKLVTEQFYSDAQSETEQSLVTAFEYFGSMGLIFAVGLAVGVAFSKLSAYVKRK
jgi:hypothetical protein